MKNYQMKQIKNKKNISNEMIQENLEERYRLRLWNKKNCEKENKN